MWIAHIFAYHTRVRDRMWWIRRQWKKIKSKLTWTNNELLNTYRLLLIIDGIVFLNGCNFKLNFEKQK